MPLIIPANTLSGGYEVANSCRFNDGDSASLTKSVSGTSQTTAGTISFWFKRGVLSTDQRVWINYVDANNYGAIKLQSDNKMEVVVVDGGSVTGKLVTNRLFRDCSAWYHCCVAINSSDGTAGNRMRLYINGTEETSFATDTNPSSGATMEFFTDGTNKIGQMNSDQYFDGYISEFVMIHGSQLTPSSFGEFDSDSPTVWKPKNVSGLSFGSKDYYLDFEDSGDLGDDESGQGNDFTENNLAAIDQASDSPTNNFATLNSLIDKGITYSEGNLQYKNTHGSNSEYTHPTIQEVSNGRWYWEIKMASTNNNSAYEYFGNGTAYVKSNGDIHPSGTTTVSNGDIFGFYLNYEDGQMTIHRNGSQVYQSSSGISLSTTTAQIAAFNNTEYQLNFGNPIFSISSGNADANGYGNFEYSPVLSGVNFYSLCTKNLAEYG